MSLGQLVLELKLNGNEFTVGLKRAEGQLGQFVMNTNRASTSIARAQKHTQSWGHTIRDVIIGLALARDAVRTIVAVTAGWQKAILNVNGEMEKSIALMKNFSKQVDPIKATAEAVTDVNSLLSRASTSPFNLQAITDTFVKLRVGGVEPAARALNTLVDSVAAFGGSGENLKRAGVAIQQMAGKGVISMEELRQQLGESVPTAINAMADAMGTSYSKLVKEISLGKVTSKPAILAMMQELELSFKGSAANMMNTWGGAVAQFETGVTRLAVAFGGLEEDGYSDGGYLKVMTAELRSLTAVMNSPEMLNSAREVGKAIAEMVKSVAEGVKWIVANKDAIYDWGKALLILWVAFKGAGIISSVLTVAGAAMGRLSMQMINMRMASMSVTASLKAQAIAMTGWNSSAAIAAGGAARIATRSTAAGLAIRGLGGALSVIAGPIGMVTALAVAGGYAWYEYDKAAKAATQSVLDLNGALTTNKQLEILNDKRTDLKKDYYENYDRSEKEVSDGYGKEEAVAYKKRKDQLEADIDKVEEDYLKGRVAVAKVNGRIQADAQISASDALVGELSRKYGIDKETLRKQMEEEAKKDGKKFDNENFRKILTQQASLKIQDEIELYTSAKKKAEEALAAISSDGTSKGLGNDQLVEYERANKLIGDYTMRIGEAKDQILELGKYNLPDAMVGADDDKLKTKFDGLKIFVDGMRKKLATLDAKVDETNPYLAQLEATIESLGGKKLPNFDQMLAEGTRLAESMWAQEKAKRALTDASKVYGDAIERIGQIENLAEAKRTKVEELNPWLKASADAQRYEDELTDLMVKMEEAKKAAYDAQVEGTGKSRMEKLEGDASNAAEAVAKARQELDRLKVSDAISGMTEDSEAIRESLMTSSEAIKAEYDRRSVWADQFYADNKGLMDEAGAQEAAYFEYRKQLDEQFRRDNESGLDAWIRQNKDASEQYKSLWGSAMDNFNDTLVDGLVSGKVELGKFVEYVLKEFLRIQMAKQMAAMAESVSGGGSGSGWMSAIVSAAGAYFSGGASMGNGMAAGSAGAVSSNLGASQAGYSSQYFANGGIMSEYGALELKKYANGGIANRPQMAIYGEGSMNEAYVPLPDGRTIPVTMSGGGSGGGMAPGPVPVEVNVYNEGGKDDKQASSNSQFDGEKMVIDIFLKNLAQPGPVRDAVKGV